MVVWQQLKLNRERKTLAHRMDSLGEQTLQLNWHYIKTIAEVILLCACQDIALWAQINLRIQVISKLS